jgi:tRNA dimethylallyltransferase
MTTITTAPTARNAPDATAREPASSMAGADRAPLVLVGSTGSGKSAVAREIAESHDLAIACLDAFTVYRHMDIGTAKPTVADRVAVRHFLVDLIDPSDDMTLVDMQDAAAAIDQPTLWVGGTGLYVRAIVDSLAPPPQFPDLRAELEARTDVDAMYAQLAALDLEAASKTEPTNQRRIVRALEVCLGTGEKFSSFGAGMTHYPPVPFAQIALRWDRAELSQRIEARIDAQLAAGWLDEAAHLGTMELSRTAQVALGYRELFAHLAGECTLADARAAIIVRTRQFAVRQERWFRRDPRIVWVDGHNNPLRVVPQVLEAWETHEAHQAPRPR